VRPASSCWCWDQRHYSNNCALRNAATQGQLLNHLRLFGVLATGVWTHRRARRATGWAASAQSRSRKGFSSTIVDRCAVSWRAQAACITGQKLRNAYGAHPGTYGSRGGRKDKSYLAAKDAKNAKGSKTICIQLVRLRLRQPRHFPTIGFDEHEIADCQLLGGVPSRYDFRFQVIFASFAAN
jgi:hypothetical protein